MMNIKRKLNSGLVVRLMLGLWILLFVNTAEAAVYTVNTTADPGDGVCDQTECTLREAITAANVTVDHDSVYFSVTGTISLASALPAITGHMSIVGPGATQLTVQRGGSAVPFGIFAVGAADVVVDFVNMTISGGWDSIFFDGIGDGNGGGIDNDGGAVNVINSVVTGNSATFLGGGVFNSGIMTVIGTTISNNDVGIGNASHGGGIYNTGTLYVVNSTISGNDAGFEGGADAGCGGGIFNTNRVDLSNSTISGNTAGEAGGGICNLSTGVIEITGSTIVHNTVAGVGGGIANVGAGTANLTSSIIAENSAPGGGGNLYGNFNSLGHNIFGPLSSATVFPGTGDQYDVALLDLKLGPLQDNGGPTMTHSLVCGSVAIDQGVNSDSSVTDQRGLGFARTVDDPFVENPAGGDGTDVGAFELQSRCTLAADLLVSLGADKTSVRQGDVLTYTITVQNFGPDAAVNTVVNDVLSSGTTFVSARANRGNFTAPPSGQTGTVTWYLGELSSGGQESAQIEVTVIVRGRTSITNSVLVNSAVFDPNETNNWASITTSVGAGGGGNGGGKKN